ncbi:unnamed protein product [marine sediment metagenome]|uniref:Uncharacterized protein n=1 Tax=marine sediment metagenome TaxID=412755 RepID=X0S5Y7_9ZZZZ
MGDVTVKVTGVSMGASSKPTAPDKQKIVDNLPAHWAFLKPPPQDK